MGKGGKRERGRESSRAWGSAYTGVESGDPKCSRAHSLSVNLKHTGEI